jgi:L-Ala-D/L-Glu epimerase
VEFIEQPLPPSEEARMEEILRKSEMAIFADESCRGPEDLEKLPGRFSGFNIKLVKCGGLTPALEMIRIGRKLDLKIMVGCMLESSLLISAGMVVAQGADYADLDGSWLLADDPFTGLEITGGHIRPPVDGGFGVRPVLPPD